MWRFSKEAGWREAESFLLAAEKDDCSEELLECGFPTEPTFRLGKSEEFAVEIYKRVMDGTFVAYKNAKTGKALEIPKAIDVKDEFLAFVEVGGTYYEVAIPTLPVLITFLSQLVPICRELRENATRQDKVD